MNYVHHIIINSNISNAQQTQINNANFANTYSSMLRVLMKKQMLNAVFKNIKNFTYDRCNHLICVLSD